MLQKFKNKCTSLMCSQKGVGTIEIVLILVVLIALVLIFRKSITSLLNTIFGQINTDAAQVYSPTAG